MALESIRKTKQFTCHCPDYDIVGHKSIPDLATLQELPVSELAHAGIREILFSEGDNELCDFKIKMHDGKSI